MKPGSPRWKALSPSRFDHEREALDFVREGLPDYEPYRAWSNAEFLASDGSINEVDLIVLAPRGMFLVEIKSRPGRLAGDAATWRWLHDGREHVDDNPLLLANLKSKRLKEKLLATRALPASEAARLFVQPIIFVSAKGLAVQLSTEGRQYVYGRGEPGNAASTLRGILDFLTTVDPAEARRRPVDAGFARALTRAMDEAGLRPSARVRRVGEWTMETLLVDGPLHQDWRATHRTMKGHFRRVRIYSAASSPGVSREVVARAAKREFDILREIDHPGILKALEYVDHDLGPTLLYEHDDRMQRLDLHLKQHGTRRGLDFRLHVLRSVGEALRYAHTRNLFHRALSPQSLLVLDSNAPAPGVKIFNWQTGVKEAVSTSGTGVSGTSHLGDVLEEGASAYMAPEALTDPAADHALLDVFSLGALAYHLFSGDPPASSRADLVQRLAGTDGLALSASANGVTASLQRLVKDATHPEVTHRLDSVKDFLAGLDTVEEELTRPAEDAIPSPDEAKVGDRLQKGFVVKRHLGKGSSAVVFEVERDGRRHALKLALSPEKNDRLRREAAALQKLNYPSVIRLEGVEEIYGRVALLLADTVKETLAERIRQDGRLTLDQLRSWGADLLKAVAYLEDTGVPHRDIKPDNLGVTEGEKDRKRLVLFDFSLSSAPIDAIEAGTRQYIDPFLSLRRPARWDLAAERWATTITLYEMATGARPTWGDGKSAPAVLKCEATLDLELLEPSVREGLGALFARALRRDPRARYDNAQDMLFDWQRAFEKVVQAAVTSHADDAERRRLLGAAKPETALAEVALSPAALEVLDRQGVATVRDLLARPKGRYLHIRGAGSAVRKEIVRTWEALRPLFPSLRTAEVSATSEPETELPPDASVDALAAALLPKRWAKASTTEKEAVPLLLGLSSGAGGEAGEEWPSQTEVAKRLGVSVPQVNRILQKHRARWQKSGSLTAVRSQVGELLLSSGGVMTAAELERDLLARRPSGEPDASLARRNARAVLRAAAEAEHVKEQPGWETYRLAGRVLVATGEDLARWADALGKKADDLAAKETLPSPERVREELASVRCPAAAGSVPPARVVRLAALASKAAAVSSRLELYPRGLSAARALKLAAGVIPASGTVSPEDLRSRVASRYPDAEPLPERPKLDDLLRAAGLELPWDKTSSSFRIPSVTVEGLRSSVSGSTVTETRPLPHPSTVTSPPPVDEADAFDDRLTLQLEAGGWLVLTALPRNVSEAETAIRARFPELHVLDVDALLVSAMKAAAASVGADWRVVLAADAAPEGTGDASNLRTLVDMALPLAEETLTRTPPRVLITNPGLLFRYRSTGLLDALRERAGRIGQALHSAWLLAPLEEPSLGPHVGGVPIPIVTPAEWARVPAAWSRRAAVEAA